MAPYRSSRTGARSTRTQIDHDVFEGLPVRHWRKKPIKVDTAPEKENVDETDACKLQWKELQMPRDYHLLPQVSQDLLRAARMPQVKKQAVPLLEDEKELGEEEDGDDDIDTGFVAKRWALISKDMEKPEPEFLAKRRKGLPSAHSGVLGTLNTTATLRKTKIRKVDADGGSSVWEVLIPDGQTVDGEVVEEETTPTQAPAPGTVLEGVGVANAEGLVIAGDQSVPGVTKRRPPPPKRRPKGPGRGRKKKVAFAGADGLPSANMPDGAATGVVKNEDSRANAGVHGIFGVDTTIGDESLLKDGDQEGEEGSSESSDEDEGEEADREEGELSASSSPASPTQRPQSGNIAEARHSPKAQDLILPQSLIESQPEPREPPTETIAETITQQQDSHLDVDTDEAMDEILDNPMHESLPHNTKTIDELLDEPQVVATSQRSDVSPRETLENQNSYDVTEPTIDAHPEAHIEDHSYHTEIGEDAPLPAITHSIEEIAVKQLPSPTPHPDPRIAESTAPTVVQSPADIPTSSTTGQVTESLLSANEEMSAVSTPEPSTNNLLNQEAEFTRESNPRASLSASREATPGRNFESFTPKQEIGATAAPSEEPVLTLTNPNLVEGGAEYVTDIERETQAPSLTMITQGSPQKTSNERLGERTHESPVEFMQEYPERKHSITRPTVSPKAPTPSPPTPIERKFSNLQPPEGPYVSPKAPTMSPPTPIDRSMSSSPEIPLSGPPFKLPPQVDVARDARSHPAFFPEADRIVVEAAPEAEGQVDAQLPVNHNPLEGLAEPGHASSKPSQDADDSGTARFSDGEEDLLGDLERSLGSRSYR